MSPCATHTNKWKHTTRDHKSKVFLSPSLLYIKTGVQGCDGKRAQCHHGFVKTMMGWCHPARFKIRKCQKSQPTKRDTMTCITNTPSLSLSLALSPAHYWWPFQNRSDISNSDLITQRCRIIWRPVRLEILQFRSVYPLLFPSTAFAVLSWAAIRSHYFCHQPKCWKSQKTRTVNIICSPILVLYSAEQLDSFKHPSFLFLSLHFQFLYDCSPLFCFCLRLF